MVEIVSFTNPTYLRILVHRCSQNAKCLPRAPQMLTGCQILPMFCGCLPDAMSYITIIYQVSRERERENERERESGRETQTQRQIEREKNRGRESLYCVILGPIWGRPCRHPQSFLDPIRRQGLSPALVQVLLTFVSHCGKRSMPPPLRVTIMSE